MRKFHEYAVSLPLIAVIAGCSGSTSPGETQARSPGSSEAGPSETRTFDDQVQAGLTVYVDRCAGCHGDAGQGTASGPAVVGDGALPLDPPDGAARTTQFRTALDVFTFASQTMPGDAPGSLEPAQMVDVLAFALSANGVTLEEPLSGDNAASIVINE